ncbi:MAG: hypothetical protein A2Z24_02850 [Candidatus Woykebacteria bacterium RBG_16_44_10]|uniref:Uncharacterized protein n=1 Tax=Candidatus Woykebacteria bacterium RBG_16_44_10 TaxID=1802597 RepID=A0A1G1WFL6_9BACT|nr:MAG: hypothetical protein A2Z24_02850 [Candidatus Woykebacteria bacterium RBG_16_44_10]
MKGFFTGICFFFFFLIAPLAIGSYLVNYFATPDYIKAKLLESKTYESVAKSVPQLMVFPEDEEGGGIPEDLQIELKGLLTKEITADYLQEKTEQVVDSTYNWFSGKTETAPTISFVDLKDKLVVYSNTKGTPLPEEVIKPFSEPVKIVNPDNEETKTLRSFSQLFQKFPLILGAVCGVLLLIIFLLAEGLKSKLRKVSLAFFVPGFLGLLSVLPVMFLFATITGAATDGLKGPGWEELTGSVKTLISAISTDVFKRMLMIYGSAIILAIVLFIVSIFVGNKAKEQPKVLPIDQKAEATPGFSPATQGTST